MSLYNENPLLFVGGDMRQIRVINEISKVRKTYILGFNEADTKIFHENVSVLNSTEGICGKFKIIILPLPYSLDGLNVNAIFSDSLIETCDIFKNIPRNAFVLAGKCDDKIETLSQIYEATLIDYLNREELQVLNAVPTAEGAIQIAMEETSHTIHNSNCLVIGNGRIGKILAKMLYGIGANVTISARKQRDLALAQSFGYSSIPIWELHNFIGNFDIIFNTVPTMILDSGLISKLNKRCLIIDLASKPGGVDFNSAKQREIKAIWALSLPGKVAPDTAGDIIKDTIINILSEMEV